MEIQSSSKSEDLHLEAVIRIKPMILEFCPDLSQRVYPDRNLPITRRTSPEEEEQIQQAT
jgi:hypothetical protein